MSLPPDLMAIVINYLLPDPREQKKRMLFVLDDIEAFGDIMLPGDPYNIRDVIEYIEFSKRRSRTYRTLWSKPHIWHENP